MEVRNVTGMSADNLTPSCHGPWWFHSVPERGNIHMNILFKIQDE